jgi:hypothetical protein
MYCWRFCIPYVVSVTVRPSMQTADRFVVLVSVLGSVTHFFPNVPLKTCAISQPSLLNVHMGTDRLIFTCPFVARFCKQKLIAHQRRLRQLPPLVESEDSGA